MSAKSKRPKDEALLAKLRALGDDLVTPRSVTLYFAPNTPRTKYQPEEVEALAAALFAEGWFRKPVLGGEYLVIVESERPVDAPSLDAIVDMAEALATARDVEFDGWECSVRSKTGREPPWKLALLDNTNGKMSYKPR